MDKCYSNIINNKLFVWLNSNKQSISSWITIVLLPAAIIGGAVGYFQLAEYFIRPDLKFDFSYRDNLFYFKIVNDTKRTAEEPYFGFVVTDLDKSAPNYLPIPFKTTAFIKPGQALAPEHSVLEQLSESGHRIVGTAMLTCRNCDTTKRYFLYIDNNKPENGFYVEFKDTKDFSNLVGKYNDAKSIDAIPINRRVTFDG